MDDTTTTHLLTNLTHHYDDDHWFPFIEDENANITGPLHQEPQAFAAAINAYDEVCNGQPYPEHDRIDPDYVAHGWAKLCEDGDSFKSVPRDAPGAFPITTLWGVR